MPLEQDLRTQLTEAIRAKDLRTADVIRMINTEIMKRRTAKGFSGQIDDPLVLEVITAYRKSLVKAKEEFDGVGERGKDESAKLQWEIEFCDKFLPKGLSADELRAAVKAVLATAGDAAKDPKMLGRFVGEVMKAHKGKVDAGAVKKAIEKELAELLAKPAT